MGNRLQLTLLLVALACRGPEPSGSGGASGSPSSEGGAPSQDAAGGDSAGTTSTSPPSDLPAGGSAVGNGGAGGVGGGGASAIDNGGVAGGESPEEPGPFLVFCGNGVVDGDDACEGGDGCASDQRCNASCQCEPQPALPLSSQALIQRALAARQIDLLTSLKLRVWALFQAPELPEEFVGAGSEGEDVYLALELSNQRRLRGDEMVAIDATLAPYIVRPNDPSSVYSRPESGGCPNNTLGASDWQTTETEHFVVWSCGPGVSGPDTLANARLSVATAAEQVRAAMVPELGAPLADDIASGPGDQSRTDIYLVPLNSCRQREGECEPLPGEPLVGTFPSSPCHSQYDDPSLWDNALTSSAYLEFGLSGVPTTTSGADFHRFRYALAHQFYHAVSFASSFGAQGGSCPRYGGGWVQSWLTEASAEWASFAFFADDDPDRRTRLFHDYQTYRRLDQGGLGSTRGQLPREAFLYLAFLQEQDDRDPSTVLRFLRDAQYAETSDQLETPLEVRLDLRHQFRDFSLRNFNRDLPGAPITPHARFDPALPFDSPAAQVLEPPLELQAPAELDRPLRLPSLGGQIEHLLMGHRVRSLRIDFSRVFDSEHVGLDVVVKVGDSYEHRAVDGPIYEFCRDETSGSDVSELYLIFSNSDRYPPSFDQEHQGSYRLTTGTHCVAGWSGVVHVAYTTTDDEYPDLITNGVRHEAYSVRGDDPVKLPGYPPDAGIEQLELSWSAYAARERFLERPGDNKNCWTHSTLWIAGSGTTKAYAFPTATGYSLEAIGAPNLAHTSIDETSNCSAFLYGQTPPSEGRDVFKRTFARLVADPPGSGHFKGAQAYDGGADGQVVVDWDLWRKVAPSLETRATP